MDAKRSTGIWLPAGIVLFGLALRLYRVDALGLASNEDYLAIAVRAVLDGGLPEFPSGVVYPRALPLTYLTAGLAALFGTSELVLRLPSVLFSTLSIAVVYLLARRLVGFQVAVLAALLTAISDWEIEVGRTARMYALLSAGCLVSVWLFHRAWVDGRRGWGAAAAAAVTGWSHQIGAAVAAMLACFPVHLGLDRTRTRLLVTCLLVTGISAGSYYLFSHAQYDRWDAVVEAARGGAWEEAPDARDGLWLEISDRYMQPWRTFRDAHRGSFAVLTALVLGSLAAVAVAAWRRPQERLFLAALALVLATLYLQQVTLAVLVLVLYLGLGRRLQSRVYRSRALALGAVVAAAGVGWLVFTLATALSQAGAGPPLLGVLKSALKPLLGYPPSFFKLYLEQYPAMSLLAGCAMLVAARRYLHSGRVDPLGLVVLLFAVPLVALGFHPQAIGRTAERYVSFLNPYFLLLAACGATWILHWIRGRFGDRRRLRILLVTACTAVLVVATGFGNLRASLALVTAEYGLNEGYPDRRGLGRHYFHPDLAGPARFVGSELRESDVVIAMDVLGHYAYHPHVDYQLTLFGKPDAEGWLAAGALQSADELAEALDRHRGARVWIVLSATHLRWFADDPRMEEVLRLVAARGGDPRYRGRDGLSDVYLVAAAGERPS